MRLNCEMIPRVVPLALALLLSGASTVLGQTPTPAQPPAKPQASQPSQPSEPSQAPQGSQPAPQQPQTQTTGDLPVNMERIKSGLDKAPTVRLDDGRLRFYLQVYAKQPRFEDFIGTFDLKNGPVPKAGMTHKEFVEMVTPKDLYSAAGITPLEVLQASITNWAAQALIRKGIQELRDARNEREILEIRARIDRELAALLGKDPRN